MVIGTAEKVTGPAPAETRMEDTRAEAPMDPVIITGFVCPPEKAKTIPLLPTAPPMAVESVRSVVTGSVPLNIALKGFVVVTEGE